MTPTYAQVRDWINPKRMQRLWSKIKMQNGDLDCWLWTGTTTDGYGYVSFTLDGEEYSVKVHRLMYVLLSGADIPWETPIVRHWLCDVRRCCNPRHLRPGNEDDNAKDAAQAGTIGKRRKRKPRRYYPTEAAAPARALEEGEIEI